jgi:hypothetical protein
MQTKLSAALALPTQEARPIIDDSRLIYATDAKGKQITNSAGRPVPIARDLVSGEYFVKIGDSFPSIDADQKELRDAGAVHQASQNPHLRGVWVPAAYFAPKTAIAPKQDPLVSEERRGSEDPQVMQQDAT